MFNLDAEVDRNEEFQRHFLRSLRSGEVEAMSPSIVLRPFSILLGAGQVEVKSIVQV
ncbi:hypothetical protein DPMN_065098 [Dreissena polymorpha]|uniref:Uncharacterized protein n=1 Tax=Dreissena polymorpha TaxID=45954 RepID=A0A9D4CEQ1_DREPO|nr:hypothetical protein DPMN_065098 [Dreissena polymorpha]